MSAAALPRFVVLLALFALSWRAPALEYRLVDRICISDTAAVPKLDKRPPVPVGCEIIDCCPGCPGAGALDWRIELDGRILQGAELRFEGLGAADLKRLKLAGAAKLDGDRIILGEGKASIGGIPDNVGGRVPVGLFGPVVRHDAAARLRSLLPAAKPGQKAPPDGITDAITLQQFLGPYPVNNFQWRHIFKPCAAPDRRPFRDQLRVQNIVGSEKVAVMMDARNDSASGGCMNDHLFRSGGLTLFDNLRAAGTCRSEIAIFGRDNAMYFESPVTTWTNANGDVHTATLQPRIEVPVTVWIAHSAAQPRATNELNHAEQLYRENNVGIRFMPTFQNVWNNAQAVGLINGGVNNNQDCTNIESVIASTFYTPKTLNVYYVNKPIYGRNCAIKTTPSSCPGTGTTKGDGNITYLGTGTGLVILAHELGHALGLRPGPCRGHPDTPANPTNWDDNVMKSNASDLADHFTLGQVFRMNTHDDEWDGTMLIHNGLRPGPGRKCEPDAPPSDQCPVLETPWPTP